MFKPPFLPMKICCTVYCTALLTQPQWGACIFAVVCWKLYGTNSHPMCFSPCSPPRSRRTASSAHVHRNCRWTGHLGHRSSVDFLPFSSRDFQGSTGSTSLRGTDQQNALLGLWRCHVAQAMFFREGCWDQQKGCGRCRRWTLWMHCDTKIKRAKGYANSLYACILTTINTYPLIMHLYSFI